MRWRCSVVLLTLLRERGVWAMENELHD
jgi:hypothetical protein